MTINPGRAAKIFGGLDRLEKSVQRAIPSALAKAVNDYKILHKLDEAPEPAAFEGTQRLAKAVTSDLIQDVVKEDLEAYAHNTLWHSSNPNELTLLKLCPNVAATRVAHEFDKILAYSSDRGFGFFSETTLPRETQPEFERVVTNLRLLGETSTTYILASLQKTINVEGETTAEGIAKKFLIMSVLRKKARAMYFSRTDTTRLGTAGARFKGLLQQIEEGTNGVTGTSPFNTDGNGHVIDMEGQPLTIATIRKKCAKVMTLFGYTTCMIMDQFVRADLEASMDSAQRLNLPTGSAPLMLGQNIGGLHTQGADIFFHTDTLLSPHARGMYIAEAEVGAPANAPTGTATAQAETVSGSSKFGSADGGDYFYMITEVKDDRESIGRRLTATVAATQEVLFSITPNDSTSDSFRVYRGIDGVDDDDQAGFAFEVANSGGGAAVAFRDLNLYRPKTSTVFALNIRTEASEFLHQAPSGTRSTYSLAKEQSEKFLSMADNPLNTVSMVTLGPAMGVMELAAVLASSARPLVYSACAMQVRNPLQNFVFINVGTNSFEG